MAQLHQRWWYPAMAVGVLALVLVAGSGGVRAGGGPGSLVVGLQDGATAADLTPLLSRYHARMTAEVERLRLLGIEVEPHRARALLRQLRAHPAVRFADIEGTASYTAEPGDPQYMAGEQWSIAKVKAPQAWDLLPPNGNTVVAVLDTGLDYEHPEFAGRIHPAGCDGFTGICAKGRTPARPQDHHGHGTHVAGIIGAATNNGVGIASVSGGRVTILPIRVLSKGGGLADIHEMKLVEAIIYAVDMGAKVVNMSLGPACGEGEFAALKEAVAYADSRDVLLVIAAGNAGGCRATGSYPANDPRTLAVAATDSADDSASFTNRGTWVSVAAPGTKIMSTLPMRLGGYGVLSGTSMATPHVAAQAALLYQVPGATKAKVMQWIMSTCDSANVSVQCGGRINVYRSVHLAMTGIDPAALPTAAAPVVADASPAPDPAPVAPASAVPVAAPAPPPAAPEPCRPQPPIYTPCRP